MALKGTKKSKLSNSKSFTTHTDSNSESSSDSSPDTEAKVSNLHNSEGSESESESEDEVVEEDASSSEESASGSENESQDDSDGPKPKRAKKNDGFGTAMDAILGSRVKAHDAADPILIRNKRTAKEIEEARSEAKARRALRAEKLQFKDRAHVPDLVPKDPDAAGEIMQREKMLRRTAQKGVVKLLNAIHNAQVAAAPADGGSTTKQNTTKQDEISKEKFLDMIRMG